MNTNPAFKVLGLEGQFPGFVKFYYDPTINKYFWIHKNALKNKIVYDSSHNDGLKVYTNRKIYIYTNPLQNIYNLLLMQKEWCHQEITVQVKLAVCLYCWWK